jgi:signal transduction histidine kinase/CheY-like chemotaxis protein
MNKVSSSFQSGDYSQRVIETGQDEVSNLAKTINRAADAIQQSIYVTKSRSEILESIIKTVDIQQFYETVIVELCHYSESQVGAFYYLNRENQQYENQASVGMEKKLNRSFDIHFREGVIGQVLVKGELVYLKNIPTDTTFAYKTVPADMIPREIISFPLAFNEQIEAIIVLASIYPYRSDIIDMINQSLPQIAITMQKLIHEKESKRLNKEIKERNVQLDKLNYELMEQSEELKNQKEELEQQNTELKLQKKEVQEANRLKSEFLSNMSHELRTPLNSIIALSDLLALQIGKQVSADQRQYLEVIARNGKNLLNLINDILDLSKIEAGKVTILPEYFSLEQVIRQVKENFSYQAKEKGVKLEVEIPPVLPQIYSDRQKINQILQNLISNAIKFTTEGSVSIKLDYQKPIDKYIISVIDTGIGISKRDLPTIFQQFKQIDGSASRKYEGTGLGLSIVSLLVKQLKGEISVQSEPGKGSAFTISFPGKITEDYTSSLLASAEKYLSERKDGSSEITDPYQYLLLLVEDNESCISQVKYLLEEEGFKVAIARGGEEALHYVQEVIPHGIILDLMMPEIDGFEVLKRIREDERTRSVPVLILTAKDLSQQEIDQLKYNKIHQLLFKGAIDRKELIEKINSMFTKKFYKDKLQLSEGKMKNEPLTPEKGNDKRNMETNSTNTYKRKILIAEDNRDNLLTMRAILKDSYTILEAVDGEEVIDIISKDRPDLILLDVGLPKIDGFQIISRLKESTENRSIPIIAVTARAISGEREKILGRGCDDYISKPITRTELIDKINYWLERQSN